MLLKLRHSADLFTSSMVLRIECSTPKQQNTSIDSTFNITLHTTAATSHTACLFCITYPTYNPIHSHPTHPHHSLLPPQTAHSHPRQTLPLPPYLISIYLPCPPLPFSTTFSSAPPFSTHTTSSTLQYQPSLLITTTIPISIPTPIPTFPPLLIIPTHEHQTCPPPLPLRLLPPLYPPLLAPPSPPSRPTPPPCTPSPPPSPPSPPPSPPKPPASPPRA